MLWGALRVSICTALYGHPKSNFGLSISDLNFWDSGLELGLKLELENLNSDLSTLKTIKKRNISVSSIKHLWMILSDF